MKSFLIITTIVLSHLSMSQILEMEKNGVMLGIDQFDMINLQGEKLFFGRSTKSIFIKLGWDAGFGLGKINKGYQFTIGSKWYSKQGKNLTIGVNASYISQEYKKEMSSIQRNRVGGAALIGYTFLVKRRLSIFPYLQNGLYAKTEQEKIGNLITELQSVEFLPLFGLDLGLRI